MKNYAGYPLTLRIPSLHFRAVKNWFLWTTSPRLLCPLVSVQFQPVWRHWQMIRGRKEREVRILISPSPTRPPACLWLLAETSFLYLRPWLGSDSPVPWLQVLASTRNAPSLCPLRPRDGHGFLLTVVSPYPLLVPLRPSHISVSSLFIRLSSIYPWSVPSVACQAPELYTPRNVFLSYF